MNKIQEEIAKEFEAVVWPQSLQILADVKAGSYGKEEMVRVELKAFLHQAVKRAYEEGQVQISGDGVYAKIGEKIYKLNESESGNMWNELLSELNKE